MCPAGTSSASDLPTMTRAAVWSAGKARAPPHRASARAGRACTERASPSAVRRKDSTAPRSRGASASTPAATTGTAPAATSSGPTAPSGSSAPSRSAPGKASTRAPSSATRPTLSASRYRARAAEARASGNPHTVMNRRLTALAPSPVGSRWLAAPAANWVASSRRRGSRRTTAPCRVQAAATQVRQVAQAAASSHGHRAVIRWPNPSASTDRCRTATTVTSSSGSTQHTRRTSRARPARRTRTDAGRATRVPATDPSGADSWGTPTAVTPQEIPRPAPTTDGRRADDALRAAGARTAPARLTSRKVEVLPSPS